MTLWMGRYIAYAQGWLYPKFIDFLSPMGSFIPTASLLGDLGELTSLNLSILLSNIGKIMLTAKISSMWSSCQK